MQKSCMLLMYFRVTGHYSSTTALMRALLMTSLSCYGTLEIVRVLLLLLLLLQVGLSVKE